jgi:hypothetical protein
MLRAVPFYLQSVIDAWFDFFDEPDVVFFAEGNRYRTGRAVGAVDEAVAPGGVASEYNLLLSEADELIKAIGINEIKNRFGRRADLDCIIRYDGIKIKRIARFDNLLKSDDGLFDGRYLLAGQFLSAFTAEKRRNRKNNYDKFISSFHS